MVARIFVALAVAGVCASALGAIAPFTEPFATDASNWRQSDGISTLTWTPMGALDGTSYGGATFNFVNQPANATPIVFRGATTYGTSGGAIFGDYRTDPVARVRIDVRQNSGVPLMFFARFSPGAAGGVALAPMPVMPGGWQTITFNIGPTDAVIYEGPGVTYTTVFSNVTRVQFGVLVPSSLAGVDQVFQFDLDNIALLPPPCVADVDDGSGVGTPDGGVTIDDLLYYLQIFEAGALAADVDDGSGTGTRDGGVTIDDLLYYLIRFEGGC